MISFKIGAYREMGCLTEREYNNNGMTVIIIGFGLAISDWVFDLRAPNLMQDVQNTTGFSSKQTEMFSELLANHLHNNSGEWGNAEKDWREALDSEDATKAMLVAINGKYPEITSKHKSALVRVTTVEVLNRDRDKGIARNSDWLDILVDDQSAAVRQEVAKYGKKSHLDILMNDKDAGVRSEVAYRLNPELLEVFLCDEDVRVRMQVAKRGTDKLRTRLLAKDFEHHSVYREIAINGTDKHRSKMLSKFGSEHVKYALAEVCYNLEGLLQDKSALVRKRAVEHASEQLIADMNMVADTDWRVRYSIAERGLFLDTLVDDKDACVRTIVAVYGDERQWEKLVNDSDTTVKREVAKHGYGLDALINDEDEEVRIIATSYPFDINSLFQ